MTIASKYASFSREPAPRLYLPGPDQSRRVFTACGEHGPGGTMLHDVTHGSQLWKLNRILLPSRTTCSHESPVVPSPVGHGLTLPPNVCCLWPFWLPFSLRQPPPVSRQRPCSHGITVSTASSSSARAVPQNPWARATLWQM